MNHKNAKSGNPVEISPLICYSHFQLIRYFSTWERNTDVNSKSFLFHKKWNSGPYITIDFLVSFVLGFNNNYLILLLFSFMTILF